MATGPLQTLVTSVRQLASDDSYKAIESIFNEIPALKEQLESKDTELKKLNQEITSTVEVFCAQRNTFEVIKTKLKTENSAHVDSIKEKDAAATQHHQAQDELRKRLDRVKKSLDEEKTKVVNANNEITELQKNLNGRGIYLDKLKKKVSDEEAKVSKVKGELKDIQEEKKSLEEELKSCSKKLGDIEGFTTKLHTYDYEAEDGVEWMRQLNLVWESAHGLVEKLFEEDLSEECLRDTGAWNDFRRLLHLERKIPIPQSNSPAAKQMRIAAMLAILARNIDQYVFQPTYLSDELDGTRKLLVRLAMADSKKESFCRSVLMSMAPKDQERNASKSLDDVVQVVSSCVRHLLADAQYERFRSDLKQVVRRAFQAWELIRHATEKLEPLFVLRHFEDIEWQTLRFAGPGTSSTDQTSAADDEALLVIFPRIYVIEDDEPDPITPGVVLRKSQAAAAAEEIEKADPPSPTSGRPGARSRGVRSARRQSISMNGANSFLPQRLPLNAH
ncbi:uncharacterized protein BP5553_00609 [Venustampulla echinocandica]|uniref:Mei5 protein n=1 Tax=Venustampulla echinocandica TaxID=2656787 RepID=A0A370TYP1_9HELO|nr:uncharacterized protein BP5553_00609 [Venustampulla echinocandica]RDL40630.1 hypothetical protein BP5553_00609 [Venustampulla echinocandica]